MKNIDIAIVLFALVVGMYVADIPRAYKLRRFWSPERKRLHDLSEWWQRRAR